VHRRPPRSPRVGAEISSPLRRTLGADSIERFLDKLVIARKASIHMRTMQSKSDRRQSRLNQRTAGGTSRHSLNH
jgi:hypothetical protein